jgi:hypothetical protein
MRLLALAVPLRRLGHLQPVFSCFPLSGVFAAQDILAEYLALFSFADMLLEEALRCACAALLGIRDAITSSLLFTHPGCICSPNRSRGCPRTPHTSAMDAWCAALPRPALPPHVVAPGPLTPAPWLHVLAEVCGRSWLNNFRLPGEAQMIDRLMNAFAAKYCECNPGVRVCARMRACLQGCWRRHNSHTHSLSHSLLPASLHFPCAAPPHTPSPLDPPPSM